MMEEFSEKDVMDTSESYCYTYKVTMIVQVIAPNKQISELKLDKDGGYVSKRKVEFVDSVFLYKDDEKADNVAVEQDKN
jgi:hypothetical protein